jgi:hypoxanthine phosphoribosyltransferase
MSEDALRQARDALARADLIHDQASVADAVRRMAARVSDDLGELDPVILCVMNGGLLPTAMLMPHLLFPAKYDYLHATRYRERTRGDDLHWQRKPSQALEGRHLLIVDDILDEGYTLGAILHYCERCRPASMRSAVLVRKEHARGVTPPVDYIGLTVPDRYVFGCGMDFKGYWRNLPAIYALPADMEGH